MAERVRNVVAGWRARSAFGEQEAADRSMNSRRTFWLAGMAIALVFSMPDSPVSGASSGQVMVAQAETGVDRGLISDIQRLLTGRGFDPGPADGIIGARTRRAIVDYQISAGLPADGVPSRSLYDHLTTPPSEPEAAAIPRDTNGLPAGAETGDSQPEAQKVAIPADEDSPPDPPTVASLTGTAWRFADSTGGEFSLAFLPDGAIEGILYARFWRWRQTGEDVVISYDNGMGLRVTRPGRLSGPAAMSGRAEPSRGEPWSWTAERIETPAASPAN